MLSRLVLNICDVEPPLISFPGRSAIPLKPCWVIVLRFGKSQYALSGKIICADVCISLSVHSQSPTSTQRSDICGRRAVGKGSESGVSPSYPRTAETVIQGEQKRPRVHHLVCWLKSCRCASPIKKEEPILAWRCKGGSRGSNVMRLTAAVLNKSYSVQIFRVDRLVLPNRHLI